MFYSFIVFGDIVLAAPNITSNEIMNCYNVISWRPQAMAEKKTVNKF
jgi:hypothetical protein